MVDTAEPAASPASRAAQDAPHDFEGRLRETLAAGAALTTAVINAQVEQRLCPTVGHQAIGAIGSANAALAAALGHTAEAHRVLEQLAQRRGISVTSYGDNYKDSPAPPPSGATDLPVIAAA